MGLNESGAPIWARERVAAAFAAVPRARFLPSERRGEAGQDRPLPIGGGATNSQPSTVRAMLELLDTAPGQRVLDVGAGSGWTTALLADLVALGGRVLGLELEESLAHWGAANLASHLARSPLAAGRVAAATAALLPADPTELGCARHAPYDRILVSAMATRLPLPLVDQLAPDGILVVPIAGRMARVRRAAGAAEPELTWHGHYRFVPLVLPE